MTIYSDAYNEAWGAPTTAAATTTAAKSAAKPKVCPGCGAEDEEDYCDSPIDGCRRLWADLRG